MDTTKQRKIHFKTKPQNKPSKTHRSIEHVPNSNQKNPHSFSNKKRLGSYKKAYKEFETIKTQKKQEKEAVWKKKEEIKAAIDAYKQKKKQKYKKLSAKTKKGQPIMKNRIEMLLEKIQQSRNLS